MSADTEKWHYLVVKKLSALLRGESSKHVGDFFCLDCFNSYTAKTGLEKNYEVCKNHDYYW